MWAVEGYGKGWIWISGLVLLVLSGRKECGLGIGWLLLAFFDVLVEVGGGWWSFIEQYTKRYAMEDRY